MQSTRDPREQAGPVNGDLLAVSPFLTTPAETFGKPVCRLGLASHEQTSITPDDVLYAVGRGVNFLNWPGEPDPLSRAGGSSGRRPGTGLRAGRPQAVIIARWRSGFGRVASAGTGRGSGP